MTNNPQDQQTNEQIDRFGAVASSLCAIHCAVCALLPAAFGALGLGMLLSQEAEWVFTIIAVLFALAALILVLRQKRSSTIAGLLGLGIIGLLSSRGLEMGSEHHHHGEGHHNEKHHDGHAGEEKHHAENKDKDQHGIQEGEHHSEHHDEHHEEEHHDEHGGEEHSDSLHSVGASMGVLGGFLLLFGHILNIRSMRKSTQNNDCCE